MPELTLRLGVAGQSDVRLPRIERIGRLAILSLVAKTGFDPFVPNATRLEPSGGTQMSDRYFPVTAMGGRLYRDAAGVYCDEAVVDMFVARIGHTKAKTEEVVFEVAQISRQGLPAVRVWVREGLEGLLGGLPDGS